jgi:hypothetical protein
MFVIESIPCGLEYFSERWEGVHFIECFSYQTLALITAPAFEFLDDFLVCNFSLKKDWCLERWGTLGANEP